MRRECGLAHSSTGSRVGTCSTPSTSRCQSADHQNRRIAYQNRRAYLNVSPRRRSAAPDIDPSEAIPGSTLREQAAGSAEELRSLVLFIAKRVIGEEGAAALAEEVHGWIVGHLGEDYPWPGNFRELEQCVRNV